MMVDKKKYYTLDDVRILGTQKKKSILAHKNQEYKTGEIFHKARIASTSTQMKQVPGILNKDVTTKYTACCWDSLPNSKSTSIT